MDSIHDDPARLRARKQAESNNKRARKNGNAGKFRARHWRAMCAWFGNVCLCCGDDAPLTVDHVYPLGSHGSNDISNLQPLCAPCNVAKGDHWIDYRDPIKLAAFLLRLQTDAMIASIPAPLRYLTDDAGERVAVVISLDTYRLLRNLAGVSDVPSVGG
jgi:hypothetical protein